MDEKRATTRVYRWTYHLTRTLFWVLVVGGLAASVGLMAWWGM